MSTTDWLAAAEGPLEPIAYHGLDGRPGFKLALTVEAGRHFLYVSHLWHSGWSVLDVTDPASPQHVRFIPGPPGTWTLQVTLRGHLLATSLEPVPPDWGGNAGAVFSEGVFIWDIADPANPRQLGHFKTGDRGTHRNGFDELGILHLSARVAGQVGLILVLVHRLQGGRRGDLHERRGPADGAAADAGAPAASSGRQLHHDRHAGVTTPGVGYTGAFDYRAEWRKFWGK